jgi:hypothetical protein
LYDCDTESLAIIEEDKLRAIDSWVLRRILELRHRK